MDLLSKIDQLGDFHDERKPWQAKYGVAFFLLRKKGYPIREAVDWIAEQEGLTKEDATEFYNTAKQWRK